MSDEIVIPDHSNGTSADAIELLLQAAFSKPQAGGASSKFLFGRPGTPSWAMHVGAEIYFSQLGLLKAAFLIRAAGPLYLRSLTVSSVKSRLMDFLKENFYLLAPFVWGKEFDGPYAPRVPPEVKAQLLEALAKSTIFSARAYPTLFPLVPVVVEQDFVSEPFFLIGAGALLPLHLGSASDIKPAQFPPFAFWRHRLERPSAWLGVRSPAESSANKLRNAILGAVALLPHPRERHLFSGRKMFGGTASVMDGKATVAFGEPCTPPMMENIKIEAADHGWLELLAGKLVDRGEQGSRHIRALEYYYRAWPLDEAERFPILFMALDAIFSDASQHTQAVADAVGATMGSAYDVSRLKLLLKMRAAVIHGGAPDVYDSKNYVKYYEAYSQDPVFDLELITARCLQKVVFEGKLVAKAHTHARILKERLGVEQ